MANQQFQFAHADTGSLVSAAQKAMSDLGFKKVVADTTSGLITARSRISGWSWGQDLTLVISPSGAGSSLSVTAVAGQAYDWGEGKRLIARVYEATERNLGLKTASTAGLSLDKGPASDFDPLAQQQALDKLGSTRLRATFRVLGIAGAVLGTLSIFKALLAGQFPIGMMTIVGILMVVGSIVGLWVNAPKRQC